MCGQTDLVSEESACPQAVDDRFHICVSKMSMKWHNPGLTRDVLTVHHELDKGKHCGFRPVLKDFWVVHQSTQMFQNNLV